MRTVLIWWLMVGVTCLGMLSESLRAEEKNGLLVTVTKKTLDRADSRTNSFYTDRIDRTQGLKATIKNTSFREMPEGEVKWTLLVRKWSSNVIYSYTGSEKLKALKPAEMVDMTIGSAQIDGWKDYNEQYKDKIEWQVVVEQAGKEAIKVSSASNFSVLEKRATKGPTNN